MIHPSRAIAIKAGFAATAAAALAALAAAPASSQPNRPPVANFTAAPNPAQPGQTVSFDGSPSTGDGQGGTLSKFEWDLDGDGVFEQDTQTVRTTTRAYTAPGTITARLRVTDSEGDIDEASVALRVNAPPTPGFIYQPSPPREGKRVVFSATASDADGQIPGNGYAWDFDNDKQFDDAAGETVTTTFGKPGKQKVRLQVTDADGATATAARKVDVRREGPRLELMKPFPTVRLSGAITPGGATEVGLLAVRGPKGARATVKCDGRGCPFDRRRRRIEKRRVEFSKLERTLRPGTVIEVLVTQRRVIGKYTRFKLREGRVPKREDRCVGPGGGKPIDCPRA